MARRLPFLLLATFAMGALLLLTGAVAMGRIHKSLVGRQFTISQYHSNGASLPLMTAMRGPEFRPDGTVTLDRYVEGEGHWSQEGDEIVVTFDRLDGRPASELAARWPVACHKLVEENDRYNKKYGGTSLSPALMAVAKSAPFPYAAAWRFRASHKLITANGPSFDLVQISGDPIWEATYRDPDFR